MTTCGEISCDQCNEERELLAKAVLAAHKGQGHCLDCPHCERGEDYQRCTGGEFDCCKCEACKLARSILFD